MKIKGSTLSLLLVAALLAAASVRGETFSAAGSTSQPVRSGKASLEGPELVEIYLVPGCRDCASIEEVDLASGIFSPSRKPFKVVSSELFLMDAQGEALFTIADPYHLAGEAAASRSASGLYDPNFRAKLKQLGAGSYGAVLKLNEFYSNVASFNVQANPQNFSYSGGPGCPGYLSIEPLVDIHGKALPNVFMAYFRNLTDDSVSLAGSTARSRLRVDGREYHLNILSWAGIADLFPGKSWGTIVRLSSFVSSERKRITVGEHEIQYKFGDCLSNVIQIRVDKVEER